MSGTTTAFNYDGHIDTFTAPAAGFYEITAIGHHPPRTLSVAMAPPKCLDRLNWKARDERAAIDRRCSNYPCPGSGEPTPRGLLRKQSRIHFRYACIRRHWKRSRAEHQQRMLQTKFRIRADRDQRLEARIRQARDQDCRPICRYRRHRRALQ